MTQTIILKTVIETIINGLIFLALLIIGTLVTILKIKGGKNDRRINKRIKK